jgi:hypothetical protein
VFSAATHGVYSNNCNSWMDRGAACGRQGLDYDAAGTGPQRIATALMHMSYMGTNDFVFPKVLLLVVIAAVGLAVLVILLIALFASGRSQRSDGDSVQSVEREKNPFGDAD